MNFAAPADHELKLKSHKKKSLHLARELKNRSKTKTKPTTTWTTIYNKNQLNYDGDSSTKYEYLDSVKEPEKKTLKYERTVISVVNKYTLKSFVWRYYVFIFFINAKLYSQNGYH